MYKELLMSCNRPCAAQSHAHLHLLERLLRSHPSCLLHGTLAAFCAQDLVVAVSTGAAYQHAARAPARTHARKKAHAVVCSCAYKMSIRWPSLQGLHAPRASLRHSKRIATST